MKKLEDAPELKAAFNKPLNAALKAGFTFWAHELAIAEHFFIAGRDSLHVEAIRGIVDPESSEPAKPKQKIVQLISHNGALHALCSEGKIWIYEQSLRDCDWHMACDLFKD